MKKIPRLAFAAVLLAAAVAQADDTEMALVGVMVRCPAISADGKHVAVYSEDPGDEKGARTSLAVFAVGGAAEQRIGVVPPAVDPARSRDTAVKVLKLLDEGGYRRMARVARVSEERAGSTYDTRLRSEDLVVDVHIADRKVELRPARGGKPLAPVTLSLGAKDGPCRAVVGYSVMNSAAGFDAASGQLALSIVAEDADHRVCFGHDFVVPLRWGLTSPAQ